MLFYTNIHVGTFELVYIILYYTIGMKESFPYTYIDRKIVLRRFNFIHENSLLF